MSTDKALEEFEEWSVPQSAEILLIATRHSEYGHAADCANEIVQMLSKAWLAAKEKCEPKWLPIETAPKKGCLIDIWIPHKDGGGTVWHECYYDSICGQWRTTGPSGHLVWVRESAASHWMPIRTGPIPTTLPEGEER